MIQVSILNITIFHSFSCLYIVSKPSHENNNYDNENLQYVIEKDECNRLHKRVGFTKEQWRPAENKQIKFEIHMIKLVSIDNVFIIGHTMLWEKKKCWLCNAQQATYSLTTLIGSREQPCCLWSFQPIVYWSYRGPQTFFLWIYSIFIMELWYMYEKISWKIIFSEKIWKHFHFSYSVQIKWKLIC